MRHLQANFISDTGEIRTRRKETVIVPPCHYWCEGDNSRQSQDSNSFGPVSTSNASNENENGLHTTYNKLYLGI